MLGVTGCLMFKNFQAWYISSTYHEVTKCQIWFLFVKGLVGYVFLDDKSLIPKSLARHLKLNRIRVNALIRIVQYIAGHLSSYKC